MIFEGSGVAIVTPFTAEGSVDKKAYQKLVKFHMDQSTDALIVCGTTGEAATMTEKERLDLVRLTKDIVQDKLPIIVGTGSNNTQASLEFSQQVEAIGVDGLLVVTPFYNKATQQGLFEHFKTIAEGVSHPILLYNVPSRTNVMIPAQMVEELSHIDNIVGLKDATGDISYTSTVRSIVSDDFAIYSGNDDMILPVMACGGQGVISVVANVAPRLTHDLCQACLEENYQQARNIQFQLLPLIKSLFVEVNPVPVKAALNLLDFEVGQGRLPLTEAEEQTQALLEETMQGIGLL